MCDTACDVSRKGQQYEEPMRKNVLCIT